MQSVRTESTTALVGDTILVWGGSDVPWGKDAFLCTLDVNTWAWSVVKAVGDPPLGLARPQSALVGRHFIVYGGATTDTWNKRTDTNDVHVLDTVTWSWKPATVVDQNPPKLRYPTVNVVAGKIVLLGGSTYSGNDFVIADGVHVMRHEMERAVVIDSQAVGATETEGDDGRIRIRPHGEAVLEFPAVGGVDDVDTGVDVLVSDRGVLGTATG